MSLSLHNVTLFSATVFDADVDLVLVHNACLQQFTALACCRRLPVCSAIEIQRASPCSVWTFCIIIRLSRAPPLMCKFWWFSSTPKLPTITMKTAALELWWLMCFYFRLPRSAKTSWAAASLGKRDNMDLCVSVPRLKMIQFSSVCSMHSVRCTICVAVSTTPCLLCLPRRLIQAEY